MSGSYTVVQKQRKQEGNFSSVENNLISFFNCYTFTLLLKLWHLCYLSFFLYYFFQWLKFEKWMKMTLEKHQRIHNRHRYLDQCRQRPVCFLQAQRSHLWKHCLQSRLHSITEERKDPPTQRAPSDHTALTIHTERHRHEPLTLPAQLSAAHWGPSTTPLTTLNYPLTSIN